MYGLVLFVFQGLAVAQKPNAAADAPLIKVSIAIDSTTVSRDKPALVTITVENTSGQELEMNADCFFQLKNLSGESLGRNHSIVGDRYWSPVNIATGTSMDLPRIDAKKLKKGDVIVSQVPKVLLKFAKDETRTFEVDLTKPFWNDSMYSMWPHETLFQVVKKGSYSLSLEVRQWNRVTTTNAVHVSVN
jgi:hypothetical protein